MKASLKNSLTFTFALVLAVFFLFIAVSATTITVIENCITVGDTLNTCTDNKDGTVTITASGWWSSKTNTVTITNSSSSKAQITFDYSATGSINSFSESTNSGSIDVTLEAGGTKTMTISNVSQMLSTTTATLVLSNFTYKEIVDGATVNLTCNDNLGAVTIGGTGVKNGGSATIGSEGATIVATPSSGASFVAWVNKDNNEIISQSVSYTLMPSSSTMNVWAVFTTSDAAPYFKVGSTLYTDLAPANSAAASVSDKKVVLISDGTLPVDTYNLSSGVTLLLPYCATDMNVASSTSTDGSGNLNSTWIHSNNAWTSDHYADVTGVLEPNTNVYLTLTIPGGATLNVASGSKLVIGGTIVGGTNTTFAVTGATAGAHSNLVVNGTLNVSGTLSCTGYILGSGKVNVSTTGAVYQPFIIMDHRDGNYAYDCQSNDTFPSNRYTTQNIQADMSISSGGRMYGYVDLYTQANVLLSARHNVQVLNIVGPVTTTESDMSLIMLSSGATMDSSYDGSTVLNVADSTWSVQGHYNKVGKTSVTIRNGATMGQTTMTISVATITENFSTAGRDFALPYNYEINLENGEYSIPYTLVMFPGSTLNVAENATLTIPSGGKLVALDGLYDHSNRTGSVTLHAVVPLYYPYSTDLEKYGFSKTSNLIVDGTMTVAQGGAFGGYVQTNGTGTVVMNGTPEAFSGVGNVANDDDQDWLYASQIGNHAGRTERTLGAWLYEADGDRITMVTGTTYCGVDAGDHTIATYDYTLYTNEDGTNQTVTGEPLNAGIVGSWCIQGHSYTSSVTKEPTCTTKGETTYTCSICGHSYTEEIPMVAHSYTSTVTEPTCTEQGYTTHTCASCGDSYVDTYTDALNHANKYAGEAKDATCTEAGHTAGEYCPDCKTWLVPQEEIAATGHSYEEYTFNSETYNSTAVCTKGCGGTDIVYTPVRFAAIQLSAESEVLLKFKLYISADLLAEDNAYILLTEAANDVTKADQVTKLTMAEIRQMETDNGRYVFSQGIAAGEMTGIVSIQAFDANGTSLSISVYQDSSVCKVLKRNVVDYTILALNSSKDTMRALSAAMVTFGGYAQAFYGVDANNPAYAILSHEDFSGLTFADQYNRFDVDKIDASVIAQTLTINDIAYEDTSAISTLSTETGSSFGIAYNAQKINLDSRVSMTTFFTLDQGADIEDYTFTLTYTQGGTDGLTTELGPVPESDGRYSVKIEDIPVAYWDYMYKLTVTKTDSDEIYVVESSVLAWAKRCILYSEKTPQVNMAKAMYYYNLAANEYFDR